MLKPLEDIIPDLPDLGELASAPCEAALAALKEVQQALQNALKLPQQLIGAVKGLLEYPFNIAEQLAADALGALDDVSNMIDELLSFDLSLGGVNLAELKQQVSQTLGKALDCPLIADSPLGQTIGSLMDALEAGLPFENPVAALKAQLGNAVREQLDALKSTPAEALNNLEDMFNDAIKRSGVEQLADQVQGLEACLEMVCSAAELAENLADRIPKSADDLLSGINASIEKTVDAVTGKVTKTFQAVVIKPVNAAQETAQRVAGAVRVAKAKVATTGAGGNT